MTTQKARPILFSAPMIRALLADRKTQTRRIIKPQPSHDQVHRHKGKVTYDGEHRMWCWKDLVVENLWDFPGNDDRKALSAICPYGKPGDLLWVRETWQDYCPMWNGAWCGHGDVQSIPAEHQPVYRADDQASWFRGPVGQQSQPLKWKPSIFMPRWASRLTLELTNVRVERLSDISESDALAEGFIKLPATGRIARFKGGQYFGDVWPTARAAYFDLWDEINGEGAAKADPFVWALTFTVHKQNIDKLAA